MQLNETVSEANLHWIAPDGLMGLEPDSFIPGNSGAMFKTVPVDNGVLFRVQFEILKSILGWPKSLTFVDLEAIEVWIRDGQGGHLRNPERLSEPATHDDICALAAAACIFDNTEIADRLYEYYGSFWKTFVEYKGTPDQKNRRRLIYWHSGFLAFCAGRIHPNPIVWFVSFIGGLATGLQEEPMKNTSNALLLWVKFHALEMHPEISETVNKYVKRWRSKFTPKDYYPVFCTYFRNVNHPTRTLARLLAEKVES